MTAPLVHIINGDQSDNAMCGKPKPHWGWSKENSRTLWQVETAPMGAEWMCREHVSCKTCSEIFKLRDALKRLKNA